PGCLTTECYGWRRSGPKKYSMIMLCRPERERYILASYSSGTARPGRAHGGSGRRLGRKENTMAHRCPTDRSLIPRLGALWAWSVVRSAAGCEAGRFPILLSGPYRRYKTEAPRGRPAPEPVPRTPYYTRRNKHESKNIFLFGCGFCLSVDTGCIRTA